MLLILLIASLSGVCTYYVYLCLTHFSLMNYDSSPPPPHPLSVMDILDVDGSYKP